MLRIQLMISFILFTVVRLMNKSIIHSISFISYIYLCFVGAIAKSLHKWFEKVDFFLLQGPSAGENHPWAPHPWAPRTFNYSLIWCHSFYSLLKKFSQIQFFSEISPDWLKMSRTGFENTRRIGNNNWRVQEIFFRWNILLSTQKIKNIFYLFDFFYSSGSWWCSVLTC